MTVDTKNDIVYLKQLKEDLVPFNPDQAEFIKQYIEKTPLKTRIISILSKLRLQLIESNNEALNKKYNEIKMDLIQYIDLKIERIAHPEKNMVNGVDPWLLLTKKSKDGAIQTNCLKASYHLHDILFAGEEVIGKRLDEGKEIECSELNEFRIKHLPGYLSILQSLDINEAEHERLENFKSQLKGQFKGMEQHLAALEYDKAEDALTQVSTVLKTYAQAISALVLE